MDTASPHLDREWLRARYEVEGLSTYEIGALVGRDPTTIHRQLRVFGIATRRRGHNLAAADNYMRQPGGTNPFQGRHHTAKTRRVLSEKASRPKPWLRGKRNGMAARTGAANPNYRGGNCPERQRLYALGEIKGFLRTIYRRDNYRCVRCGSPKLRRRGLHAHHLKGWAEHPDLRFDPANVVTLCRECHEWVHSAANTSRELLS